MDGAAVNGAGEERIAARTSGVARETKRGLAIYPGNDRDHHGSAFASVVRWVRERFGRAFSAHGGGAKLSSCAPRRFGRAHRADDADREQDRAAVSAIECRSFAGRHFVSRLRQALGKRAARKRIRHGLRRARRINGTHLDRARIGEFIVAKNFDGQWRRVEKPNAAIGRCASAFAASNWSTSWRTAVWFTGESENAGGDGAPLHRQSGRAAGNV